MLDSETHHQMDSVAAQFVVSSFAFVMQHCRSIEQRFESDDVGRPVPSAEVCLMPFLQPGYTGLMLIRNECE
jgi:hypothetical protein